MNTVQKSNTTPAANPAMTSLFHVGCQWRGGAEARRYADRSRQVMKALLSTALLASLLLGCRSADPIDRLAARLNNIGGPSTHVNPVDLPGTASPEEVACAALQPLRTGMHVEKVLEVRKVQIVKATCTGVLVDTNAEGRKIVLILYYRPNLSEWMTQVYDAE
jgi:hypothetical protein